jgi:hypothetical protein
MFNPLHDTTTCRKPGAPHLERPAESMRRAKAKELFMKGLSIEQIQRDLGYTEARIRKILNDG